MTSILPAEVWYVISTLLGPIGYVVQDAVADAMTVDAVPRVDEQGRPFDQSTLKLMHTTMQTLGRVAIIGGGILVAMINLYLFTGVEGLPQAEIVGIYRQVYLMALVIPFISVLGVGVAWFLQQRHHRQLREQGFTREQINEMVRERRSLAEATRPNWWILGGSLAFVLFTLTVGLGGFDYSEEIVFVGSMAIVLFLMVRLVRELEPDKRFTLVGHGDCRLHIPSDSGDRARDDLVDDRPPEIRSAVPLRPLADRQHVNLGGHVRLSPLHG